uniref:Uncharacterized protein n=1 Tax=viral metagenome TaxID=1070528 RepID=A0A6H1ZNV0_9ZZZZ
MKLIKDQQMDSKIVKDLGDLGVGYFYFQGGAAAVGDQFTIGGTEVWTAIAGAPGAAAYEFDQSGGTAATCATSLGAQINAVTGGSLCRAVVSGNVVLLFALTAAAGNLALAVTTNVSTFLYASAAAQVGSLAARVTQMSYLRYALVAADITSLALGNEIVIGAVATTTQPQILGYAVADATGGLYAPAGLDMLAKQSGANEWLVGLKDTTGILAATDILTVTLGF